jgi:hypothetical protein
MKRLQRAGYVVFAVCMAGCTPALDWREFIAEGSGLVTTFPCRPDRHARDVVVAGATARMEMLACEAGKSTFALGFLDVADPTRVAVAMVELRSALLANVQGGQPGLVPAVVGGMTLNSQALRLEVVGRLPDGVTVDVHAQFFVKGLRVYQATVIGHHPSSQTVETFFGGLKFPS